MIRVSFYLKSCISMDSAEQTDKPRCINCGAKLRGKYCHKCGEKVVGPGDFALKHFFREAFRKFTHLDSRFLRSFYWLVCCPGFLTAEYLRGRRRPYLKPLSLFLVINLLYFLSMPLNRFRTYENPLASQLRNPYHPLVERLLHDRFGPGETDARAAFEPHFDRQNHVLSKSLLILMVPMLALMFWLLYPRRYFGEHLIAALHFLALLLVLNMFLGILLQGGLSIHLLQNASLRHIMVEMGEPLLWVGVLAFFSFRKVYQSGWMGVLWRAVAFVLLWFPVLIVYRFMVFLATFYTI